MAPPRKAIAAPSRIVPGIVRHLRARGVRVEPLLRRLALPADAESQETVAIVPQQFQSLIAAGVRELADPLLALRLPEALSWDRYHIGELAARAAPTLQEAFARVVRYASLFYAHLRFAVEERGSELIVTNRLRHTAPPVGRYSNEFAVASTLAYAERMVGRHLTPIRVWFAHTAPRTRTESDAIRAHFGATTIAFRCVDNGVAFPRDVASLPSVGRDPRLLATAEALADRALADQPPDADFVSIVAHRLRQAMPHGPFSAAALATQLKLSTRTLQRRLIDQGTTLSAVHDRVRQALAAELLADPEVPLAEIAYRTGFSDAAAFSRAWKRWTGKAPSVSRTSSASSRP